MFGALLSTASGGGGGGGGYAMMSFDSDNYELRVTVEGIDWPLPIGGVRFISHWYSQSRSQWKELYRWQKYNAKESLFS